MAVEPENDLESAILKELELFILELGAGFTFVERQKRIIIDGEVYSLDLLFFHRKLRVVLVRPNSRIISKNKIPYLCIKQIVIEKTLYHSG